jgi:putative transcriptional regulator
MHERDIGKEILEGIREIKDFKKGKTSLRTRKLIEPSPSKKSRKS